MARTDGSAIKGLPPLPVLDGFRALAILIVMISHADFGKMIPGGFGVTIFFFLSGYLITSILRTESDATRTVSLWNFYRKRFYRIFPPMFITLALLFVLMATGILAKEYTAAGILADMAFLTNYAPQLGIQPAFPVPLWSLDVEEHFYIGFSALYFFVLTRISHGRAFALCAALCVAVLSIRIAIVASSTNIDQIYYWTHTRIDSILFGSCLALWRNPALDVDGWAPRLTAFVTAIGVLLLCLIVRNEMFRETLRYSLQGMALFVVFAYAINDRGVVARLLGSRSLRWVAATSYTLYLIHFPAIMLAEQWHMPLPFVWAMVGSAIYAGAMNIWVERPLARWSRRAKPGSKDVVTP